MTKTLETKKPIRSKKVDVSGTIKTLNVGETVKFNYRQAKSTTVRVAVLRISKKSKMEFIATEKDMIGEIMVIRTK